MARKTKVRVARPTYDELIGALHDVVDGFAEDNDYSGSIDVELVEEIRELLARDARAGKD